jgi:hypothetical protein
MSQRHFNEKTTQWLGGILSSPFLFHMQQTTLNTDSTSSVPADYQLAWVSLTAPKLT